MYYNELHVYDLDGTLLHTPEKPKDYKGGWWGKAFSLEPPVCPHRTDKDISNKKVLESFRKSRETNGVLTVMMTGRLFELKPQVDNLMDQYNIDPDFYFLNQGGNTLEEKMKRIYDLLEQYPEVNTVHIWEDRAPHIEAFEALGNDLAAEFYKNGRPFFGTVVHRPPDWD